MTVPVMVEVEVIVVVAATVEVVVEKEVVVISFLGSHTHTPYLPTFPKTFPGQASFNYIHDNYWLINYY